MCWVIADARPNLRSTLRCPLLPRIPLRQRRIARLGRAAPAAARGQDDEALAGLDPLGALAGELLAALDRHRPRRTGPAAMATAWGVIDAVEGGEKLEGLGDAALDLDDLAEAAARLAFAAGAGAQLLPPEDQRRDGLGDLHRRALDAGGIGGGGEAVGVGPRAGAAVGRHRHGEAVVAARAAFDRAAHVEVP